jgi:hypothetical protein
MYLLRGEFPVYGVSLGIIMLDCKFPRPIGDIGNASTFPYPVQYEVLEGVPSSDLIYEGEEAAIDSLIEAAKRLERRGVRAILTSCGLLIRYQELLAQRVKIPVATSSLLFLPFLGTLIPKNRKIGIITADVAALNHEILRQAGWTQMDRIVIKGMEGCDHFKKSIMEPSAPFELDTKRLCEETLSVGRQLMSEESGIGVLLLECTNLAPYSGELRRCLSIPVYDVTQLAYLLHASTYEETWSVS